MRAFASILMLLVGTATAPAGAQQALSRPAHPGHDLWVNDATGRPVGMFITSSVSNGVVLRYGGTLVGVRLTAYQDSGGAPSATDMAWPRSSQAYFPTANCSGPPIVTNNNFVGLRPYTIVSDLAGGAVLHIGAKGLASLRSYQSTTLGGSPAICTVQSGAIYGWDTEATVHLTSVMPEPLRLEMR